MILKAPLGRGEGHGPPDIADVSGQASAAPAIHHQITSINSIWALSVSASVSLRMSMRYALLSGFKSEAQHAVQ